MMNKHVWFCLLFTPLFSFAQILQPGFNKAEYGELLRVSAKQFDSAYWVRFKIAPPADFTMAYRSPITGLDNRWDLWMNKEHTIAAISLRGTTGNSVSWLENFYAAMVPAKGELQLNDSTTFKYQLAENDKAAVHVGWLVGMASMANNIVSKIDSCYKTGIRNFYIMGHSQGGAIAYLLTSYLHYQQQNGAIPKDLIFKTYCSAAPKPGNLFYAYDYESYTTNGWAYNVVNSADWVPQTPIAIQTLDDFNATNPFVNAKAIIRKLKFPANIILRHAFNRLNKTTRKARDTYQKYLGSVVYKFVRKTLPQLGKPDLYESMQYERAGNYIVLNADADYYKKFPDSRDKIFVHHNFDAYLFLLQKLQ
ncbi:MAG: lipase family protein [Bacteroidota bacterium]|nr:lipase family protein [Bacteroidota bacterium]